MSQKKDSYEDIINLPHHQSAVHPRMSPGDRAAQFSPFAALTGHEAAIRKTAERVEQDRDSRETEDIWET